MNLSRNFTLKEFEDAAHGPLNAQERDNAEIFALAYLQPLRDAMGFPICITSFARRVNIGGGAHAGGRAIDFVACDRSPEKLERMFKWLATHATYGELIHERDHLHLTLPGVGGMQETLREPREGDYIPERVDYVLEPIYATVTQPRTVIAGLITALLVVWARQQES